MARISENQLRTWARQGATTTSASTYESIKNCIDNVNWNNDVKYDIYLQGSYRNTTNIYGNSDVDLVVQFDSIFNYNIRELPDLQQQMFNKNLSNAKYTLADFKEAIIRRLRQYYGDSSIEVGDKSIKVKGNRGNRLDADVVVCNPYRKYKSYSEGNPSDYVEGIKFVSEHTNEVVINYPKVHYQNGVNKNDQFRTNGNYKSVARILKNVKADLVKKGTLQSSSAPSYFIECLTYNGKDYHFRGVNFTGMLGQLMAQLTTDVREGKIDDYKVVNEQRLLFGYGDQQWNLDNAKNFILAVTKRLNER